MKLAIMGYGVIGSGVAEVLKINQDQIMKKVGEPIELKYILDQKKTLPENGECLIHDFSVIEKDPEVALVVETMGGIHPAYEYIKSCLEKGKHVISSNKAVVDACGSKLIRTAREHDCNFYFEASVGGGIPVIRTLYHNYAGEEVTEITGILNGTTNFILSQMKKKGAGFSETLREAQQLGYAERDPSADVDGFDTSRKTAILLSMTSGNRCRHEDIYTEGIRNVSAIDFEYAEKLGMNIRLLGSVQAVEDRYFAYVAPLMIGSSDPLYPVDGVFNGIRIVGNCLGTTMLYGMGAGKLPTASAVVSDIIAAVRHRGHFQGIGWSEKMIEIEPMGSNAFRYLARIEGTPEGLEEALREAFLEEETAFRPIRLNGRSDEFAVLTDILFEEDFLANLKDFEEKTGRRIFHFIRVKCGDHEI
ncbi:homoserine dehydrogenase [Oribacterium sp. oral taxon 078 str. F0262]|uniref:homoserine dehydrogenase n=1 Tax=Oribacterium sp. oral taxon 078 TaxID=652706 RepID=UPI0001BCBF9B|nr:homoserine dehydrogenase [Oribacterium sp. oral taxon 078]EFE92011.1 homoserine dehydrogenase [Oribacterium sp. oral taxon 078 str. F0262]